MKAAFFAIFILILLSTCNAATIHGTIYDFSTFEVVKNAVVKISTTPEQRVVSIDGNYSFSVPLGNYVLTAFAYDENDELLFYSDEISVKSEGNYEIDIILLPEELFSRDEKLIEQYESEGYDYLTLLKSTTKRNDNSFLAFIAMVVIAAILIYFLLAKMKKQKNSSKEYEDRIKKEVIAELEKVGGRIEQKELRQKLKYSESQISLVVTQLESEGFLKKIKKGRANILVLLKK